MGIWKEAQFIIECDKCGETHCEPGYNKTEIIKYMRETYSWVFGKQTICPKCKGAYRKLAEVHNG